MCVLLQLFICTALRAHTIVVEALCTMLFLLLLLLLLLLLTIAMSLQMRLLKFSYLTFLPECINYELIDGASFLWQETKR